MKLLATFKVLTAVGGQCPNCGHSVRAHWYEIVPKKYSPPSVITCPTCSASLTPALSSYIPALGGIGWGSLILVWVIVELPHRGWLVVLPLALVAFAVLGAVVVAAARGTLTFVLVEPPA